MKKTLNNSSKKYEPILDTAEPFGWCPGHSFFHSTLNLSVNPSEGVDQGQKVLEMKNKNFSTKGLTKYGITISLWVYSLVPKLWWKSWFMKQSTKVQLGLEDPKQAAIHLASTLKL